MAWGTESMDDSKITEVPLTSKADAAFLQAAKEVIQKARQTRTPIIIWEENQIKEITDDRLAEVLGQARS
jgi:hypothetical protein